MKRGINLKKALLIMLCILVSISFSACNKNSTSDDSPSVSENISAQDDNTSNKETTGKAENDKKQNEKAIKKLYISYSGINIDITTDENRIAELSELEKNAAVPEVNLITKFADITAVYDDNTEDVYGSIYIGDDKGYYLQFANSAVEGAAYKMTDSSFANELF